MSDLFSSLLIFTIVKNNFKYIFFTVSKFYKNLVKWALTEMLCSVAGTTTLDKECLYAFKLRVIVKWTTFEKSVIESQVDKSFIFISAPFDTKQQQNTV
jgi:hypothetical protein